MQQVSPSPQGLAEQSARGAEGEWEGVGEGVRVPERQLKGSPCTPQAAPERPLMLKTQGVLSLVELTMTTPERVRVWGVWKCLCPAQRHGREPH